MSIIRSIHLVRAAFAAAIVIAATVSATQASSHDSMAHISSKFAGPKANKGTVTHSEKEGKNILTLSDDFVVPETPAPHWQIVDSSGNVYLLQRLKTTHMMKDVFNQEIIVPAYIHDIAKVQIWCAFAETNLGEATFTTPITLSKTATVATKYEKHGKWTTSGFSGPKANTGSATIECKNGVCTLTLSDDFKVPDAPAPHWQVIDSKGNAYLLNKLQIKGDKLNKTITVPAYVPDIAKVQIWCAYAEVVLGEATLDSPVM
jgi:hypothetical protein